MATLKKAPYAMIGTGDFAMEKARTLVGRAKSTGRPDFEKLYEDLAKRGEGLIKRIQRSKPAKRAAEGTRQATRQLKGAVTSIRKAAGLEEQRTARKAG